MSLPGLELRLPATSANLGPGFDAAGLAMDLWLEVEAEAAEEDSIAATGRDAEMVGRLEGNLLLGTYRAVAPRGPRLRLAVTNGIPLGMGCGSSAAAILAGVALGNHFGELRWTTAQVLDEACRREGHPDNVAACALGGFTVSSMAVGRPVETASFGAELDWELFLALPTEALSTSVARGLLPDRYSRADAVANVQATAMLVAAFALGRAELLGCGTQDTLHQPYRAERCPLLGRLLPLAGTGRIRAVTLSGAGPSVLLIAERGAGQDGVPQAVMAASGGLCREVLSTRIAGGTGVKSRDGYQRLL